MHLVNDFRIRLTFIFDNNSDVKIIDIILKIKVCNNIRLGHVSSLDQIKRTIKFFNQPVEQIIFLSSTSSNAFEPFYLAEDIQNKVQRNLKVVC